MAVSGMALSSLVCGQGAWQLEDGVFCQWALQSSLAGTPMGIPSKAVFASVHEQLCPLNSYLSVLCVFARIVYTGQASFFATIFSSIVSFYL